MIYNIHGKWIMSIAGGEEKLQKEFADF